MYKKIIYNIILIFLIFLESGNSIKATESAIRAKEWNKAIEILNILNTSFNKDEVNETISQFYIEIARYYEAEGQYDVNLILKFI